MSARLPTTVMRAKDRGVDVLKERAAQAEAAVARRNRKEDISPDGLVEKNRAKRSRFGWTRYLIVMLRLACKL